MKKLLSILLALVLCTTLFAFANVAAEEDNDTLLVAMGFATGTVGETVELDLDLLTNPGFGCLAVKVSYDKDKLELQSVTKTTLPAPFVNDATDSPKGTVPYLISWRDKTPDDPSQLNPDTTYTGTLATFSFKILEAAAPGSKIPVTIEIFNAFKNDIDMTDVPSDKIDGFVLVGYKSADSSAILYADPDDVTIPADAVFNYEDATDSVTGDDLTDLNQDIADVAEGKEFAKLYRFSITSASTVDVSGGVVVQLAAPSDLLANYKDIEVYALDSTGALTLVGNEQDGYLYIRTDSFDVDFVVVGEKKAAPTPSQPGGSSSTPSSSTPDTSSQPSGTDTSSTPTSGSDTDKNPVNGETTVAGFALLLLVVASAIVVVTKKKVRA